MRRFAAAITLACVLALTGGGVASADPTPVAVTVLTNPTYYPWIKVTTSGWNFAEHVQFTATSDTSGQVIGRHDDQFYGVTTILIDLTDGVLGPAHLHVTGESGRAVDASFTIVPVVLTGPSVAYPGEAVTPTFDDGEIGGEYRSWTLDGTTSVDVNNENNLVMPAQLSPGPHTLTGTTDATPTHAPMSVSGTVTVPEPSLAAPSRVAASSLVRVVAAACGTSDPMPTRFRPTGSTTTTVLRAPRRCTGLPGLETSRAFTDVDTSGLPLGSGSVEVDLASTGRTVSARVEIDPSTVTAPIILSADKALVSHSNQFQLVMQGDGNLVLYGNGRALWSSGTWGHPGAFTLLQTDGNLIVYDPSGRALWYTATSGHGPGSRLTLQDDGNLVLYDAAGRPTWYSGAAGGDVLSGVSALLTQQSLHSANWRYRAVMQSDGNFVVYDGTRAIWNSRTVVQAPVHPELDLDATGHISVFEHVDDFGDNGGLSWWCAGPLPFTYPSGSMGWTDRGGPGGGSTLHMQNDGNLVLYDAAGHPTWNSRGYPV